ncbi:hypothetical protein L2E82_28231 [Cichorium intybus]|uniref:Uncharacterized protein n=1 Tax=Cichorium intybus TaxID=13427 RepID=A0ACB9CVK0_CICIN|nr:hypothetical protein L2E82_28231 [Cichorium intybus]
MQVEFSRGVVKSICFFFFICSIAFANHRSSFEHLTDNQAQMAICPSLASIDLIKFNSNPIPKFSGITSRPSSFKFSKIKAVQDTEGGRRRLIDIIRVIPDISRNYFKSPSRRTLFGGISLLGGFYVAQTISLSFGALAVNDVIAAVVCVLLTEYVTRFYYSRPKVTFPIALLNNFKMGFTYGLFIDAFKLAS